MVLISVPSLRVASKIRYHFRLFLILQKLPVLSQTGLMTQHNRRKWKSLRRPLYGYAAKPAYMWVSKEEEEEGNSMDGILQLALHHPIFYIALVLLLKYKVKSALIILKGAPSC